MAGFVGYLRLMVFGFVAISVLPANDVRTDILPALTCDVVRCLGPVEYVCRHVQPCPSCQIVPRCFLKDQIKEGIDKRCRRQNFSEVILKEDQTNSSVHTELKCSKQAPTSQCPFGSVCVSDSSGRGVCCRGRIGPINPPEKPGVCPMGEFSACQSKPCKKDFDCPDDQKCCPSCGNLCANPVNTSELCGLIKCQPGQICLFRQPFCHSIQEPCTKLQFPTCVDPVCESCTYNQLCIPHPSPSKSVECFSAPDCGGCPTGEVCTPSFEWCTPFTCPVFECLPEGEEPYY